MFPYFSTLLNNPGFLSLWVSQILSQLTINIVNFTLITRIFERTESTIAVSLFWVTYALPAVMLLPITGPVVDTLSRKKILFFTNLLQGGTVLLFLVMSGPIYSVFPLVFLYSILNQFYLPAEAASIPDLVDKKYLPGANSLFLMTAQFTFILGFGIGGPLFHRLGDQLTFSISALMLLIGAMSITFIPNKASKKINLNASLIEFFKEFQIGYQYIINQKGVLFPLIILTTGFTLLSVMGAIFPLIGRDILGTSVRNAGTNIFVPVGLGAVLGSILAPKLLEKTRKRKVMETGIASIAVILIFFSLVIPAVTENTTVRLWLSIPAIFILGVASVLVFVPSQTVIQERTPDILRGRILGVLSFFTSLASIVPLIIGSAVAEFLGIQTVLILAAGLMSIGLYYSRKLGDSYI